MNIGLLGCGVVGSEVLRIVDTLNMFADFPEIHKKREKTNDKKKFLVIGGKSDSIRR